MCVPPIPALQYGLTYWLLISSISTTDHGEMPIDINSEDKTCNLKTYSNLFSMRNPNVIVTLHYNDRTYVITANEGKDKEYGSYKDNQVVMDIFNGTSFGLPRMVIPHSVFNPKHCWDFGTIQLGL